MKRNSVSSLGLAYNDRGRGPVVLLLHAFGLNGDMWDPQVECLHDRGFRTIVPDFRGFGDSPGPQPGFSFSTSVADIVSLLDDAVVEEAVLVGLSMGAAVSVAIALDHPERIAGLFIADNSRPDGYNRAVAAAERITRLGMEGLADVYEPILFGEPFRSAHPDAISEWRQQLVGRDADELATIVMAYHDRPDPGPRLSEIRAPAVLVFGEDDAAIPEDRRADYRPIRHLEEHRIPGAGHISNLEAPEVFNELLLALTEKAFVARQSAARLLPDAASGPGNS